MCDPLTLSSPNEETRRFWINHGKACIRISQYLAEELGQPCTKMCIRDSVSLNHRVDFPVDAVEGFLHVGVGRVDAVDGNLVQMCIRDSSELRGVYPDAHMIDDLGDAPARGLWARQDVYKRQPSYIKNRPVGKGTFCVPAIPTGLFL